MLKPGEIGEKERRYLSALYESQDIPESDMIRKILYLEKRLKFTNSQNAKKDLREEHLRELERQIIETETVFWKSAEVGTN